MGNNKNPRIKFKCDYCKKDSSDKPSHYKLKLRHFCSQQCYSKFRSEVQPIQEHPRWLGGFSKQEIHRRYVKRHPELIAHLKSRRYAREKNAVGQHSLIEWQQLKNRANNLCVKCGQEKPLTKDHIIPLSIGGSDYISNIQPLCRNCNSQKWAKLDFNIHENPELLIQEDK